MKIIYNKKRSSIVKNLKLFIEYTKTNESLRDKMTPKSDDVVNKLLANKSKDELIQLYLKRKEKYILDYLYTNFDIKENPLNLDIDKILNGYLYAALWTEELDGEYDINDIEFHNIDDIKNDIRLFISLASDADALAGISEDNIGSDLWLTRNGHGAGFWDREDIDKEVRWKLTSIANDLGNDYTTQDILSSYKDEDGED